MRELQTAHTAAEYSAPANIAGTAVLPARHPAKMNGDGRRPGADGTSQLRLDQPEPAVTAPPPRARPRPQRGRRASDRRPNAFPHPSQLTPQAPFMAQLMSQDQLAAAARAARPPPASPVAVARLPVRVAEADLVSAQRRHFEQVGAYRRTVTMATDFIIRRYHLAADFQGLMLADSRTVEMVV